MFIRPRSPFVGFLTLLMLPLLATGQTIVIAPVPTPAPSPTASLEVRGHSVHVKIDGQLATTTIDQVFFNPTGLPVEGTFVFPMPRAASVERFSMDVNGEDTEAELLDAEKARSIYEDIVRRARDPALLEYCEHDLLRARIFPIEPKSEKRVRLRYTQLLESDGGLVGYTYPLMGRTVDGRQVAPLAMEIELKADRPITNVYSPTHAVEIDRQGERRVVVGTETEDAGGGRFELLYALRADDAAPVAMHLLTHRDPDAPHGDEGFFLLLASPGADSLDAEATAKDIVFVLDTSGSMAGEKLDQARRALRFCLDNLGEHDRFEVVRFSTGVEPLFGQLQSADAEHRRRARRFVDGFKPIGGTAIHAALDEAMSVVARSEGNHPAYVVFLTDGRPTIGETDAEAIVKLVDRGPSNARVFCFGIGTDINTRLLDGIAEAGRATTEYVLPDEDLELKLSRFYTKIAEPVMTDLRVEAGDGVRLTRRQPQRLPDLFRGEQLVVFGRYDGHGDATVTLRGTIDGEERAITRDLAFPREALAHESIARLWAMRRVGFLLDEIRLRGENDELRDEVVKLARDFGIVTPYTAYLIVEDEERQNVPLARRSLQDAPRDVDALRSRYETMAKVATGADAVAGAQANKVMREAQQPMAAAESNAWADGSKLGVVAQAAAPAPPLQATRYAKGRAFVMNGTRWVDTQVAVNKGAPVQLIVFNSEAYFDLLREHPEAAEWLAVAKNLQVVINGQVYEIVEGA